MPAKKQRRCCAGPERVVRYPVIKIRLYPTQEQSELLEKTFGCCRYLWNQMLCDVQEFYAATDLHYIPTPAKYKKSAPFLTAVDSQALCAVHQNLRKAFMDFFRAPKRYHYPQFKTKKAQKDSFTVYSRPYHTGPSIVLTAEGVRMPKLGCIPANLHRNPQPDWLLRSVTVTKTKTGKYFCAVVFKCEVDAPAEVTPSLEKTIGLNHSLHCLYVDSNGNCVHMPVHLTKAKAKLSRMQRKLSGMQRGSRNYEKQAQKIRLLQEHIANQRNDFLHKESRRIANAWDAVCVRDTDLVKLSQKVRGANVLDFGFGSFRACLKYKLEQQGKRYAAIDPYAPTAKTCSQCGGICEHLDQGARSWVCPQCGACLSREENAARNIRDWGYALLCGEHLQTGAVS